MALLDLNQQTTTRLGLEPIKGADGKYLFNGCVPTRVIDIKVSHQKHEKGEFSGSDVPVLQIEFENFKLNANDPDRFYTYSLKVVGSKQLVSGTSDQYENRDEVDINSDNVDLWKAIKHFLENLNNSPNYRDITKIPKTDFTTYFDLPGNGVAADRLKKYEDFFGYITSFVLGDNKDIKSQLIGADGKAYPMWVKLLPNYDRDPKRNAKYYAISRFINQGVFEPMKVDKGLPVGNPLIIKVKATENLELTKVVGASTTIPGSGSIDNPSSNAINPDVAKLLHG